MQTAQNIGYGVVQFMTAEAFQNPYRGLDEDARTEKVFAPFSDVDAKLLGVGESLRVTDMKQRNGGEFVIEASAPSCTVSLHFCSEKPGAGEYEIHFRPRIKVEKGRIIEVNPVSADETDPRLWGITPFENRFVVATSPNDQNNPRRVWLVGLKKLEAISGTEQST